MVLFQYEALGVEGRKVKGEIDSETIQGAKTKLAKRQLLVIALSPLKEKDLSVVLTKQEVIHFTRELSRLLTAGLPLYEALLGLEEKYRGNKVHRLVLHLCDQIRNGASLSSSLLLHGKSFDFLYCTMIANAEQSGRLSEALEEMASHLSKQERLKKQLLSALFYPAIVGSFCCLVIGALLFFIIPTLFELFEGRTLHPLTKVVLALSKGACAIKGYLIFFALGMVFGGLCFFRSAKGRALWKRFLLHLPGIRDLITKAALIRFTRSFAVLLQGGISYLSALHFASQVVNHPPLEKELETIAKKVGEGSSLSLQIKQSAFIPPLVGRMLAIAEEGGGMATMLHHIALIYEEELEKSLAQLTAILQPLLLLFLGFVVGGIVLSVLLPLTDVRSFLGGSR